MVSTPVSLTAGNKIRLVVQNPFPVTDQTAVHGEETSTPLPAITTSTKIPILKSLTFTLLDSDLQ